MNKPETDVLDSTDHPAFDETIYVTRPHLPPLESIIPYLEKLYESRILTNNGRYLQQFETNLRSYLGVRHCTVVSNATLALMITIKAMQLKGRVIVPSFTFLAVPHSVSWCGLEPVFCDVDESVWGMDPEKAERLITPDTSAIIPVMPYGVPLDVEAFERLASRHDLKLIFDSASAMGARYKDRFLGNSGHAEIFSFHATKLFTTLEGGAILTDDDGLHRPTSLLRNFGFEGETQISACGINAKMHEISAAFGIEGLKLIEGKIEKLRSHYLRYRENLSGVPGLHFQSIPEKAEANHSFFPVRICQKEFGKARDDVYKHFLSHHVHPRRYFYPPCHWFDHYRHLPSSSKDNLAVTEELTRQLLCLPMFVDLQPGEIDRICGILLSFAGHSPSSRQL